MFVGDAAMDELEGRRGHWLCQKKCYSLPMLTRMNLTVYAECSGQQHHAAWSTSLELSTSKAVNALLHREGLLQGDFWYRHLSLLHDSCFSRLGASTRALHCHSYEYVPKNMNTSDSLRCNNLSEYKSEQQHISCCFTEVFECFQLMALEWQ